MLPDGIPLYPPRAIRRIEVGQVRRRLSVRMAIRRVRASYKHLISAEQAAWLGHRSGIRNAADLQFGLRYWATQAGLEVLSFLFDLADVFPRLRRPAMGLIRENINGNRKKLLRKLICLVCQVI